MPTPTSARRGSLKKRRGRGWACTICPAAHRGQSFFPNFEAALDHEQTAHEEKLSAVKDDRNANRVDGVRVPGDHLQTVDESDWDKIGHGRLTSEGLRQWEMHAHVDHVFDLVPFWQRGVDAAERGEVLRLEEFLEKMEGDGGWRTANEVLGMLGGDRDYDGAVWGRPSRDECVASQCGERESNAHGWEASQRGGWGAAAARMASDGTESSRGGDDDWGIREEWATGESDLKMKSQGMGGRVRAKRIHAVGGCGGREELRHFVDAIARQEAVNEERRKEMHLFFEMSNEQKIQKIQESIRFLRAHAPS